MPNTTQEIRTETITLTISDGSQMPAYVARPATGPAGPGLMVFQEAFGVNAHIRDMTERFARQGFTAIAPALFHRTDPNFEGSYTDISTAMPHMQALTDEGQAADIQAAYAWLASAEGGPCAKIGSVGYCMGGKASFLADSVVPVQASISYYGGGIAPQPSMGRPGMLERVPQLHAPIHFFWGGADTHIGPEQRHALEDALIAAGKPYGTTTFSEAEHGFSCDVRASYNPQATHQAWALTLAFFADHLGS